MHYTLREGGACLFGIGHTYHFTDELLEVEAGEVGVGVVYEAYPLIAYGGMDLAVGGSGHHAEGVGAGFEGGVGEEGVGVLGFAEFITQVSDIADIVVDEAADDCFA